MPRLAIAGPNKDAWSETFIRAHREKLFPEAKYIYGAWLPRFQPDGKAFLSGSPILDGLTYHGERLLGGSGHDQLRKRIGDWLEKEKIEVVLAEYGPTGVELLPVCQAQNIPLVVIFHGFDAYDGELLKGYGPEYPGLFSAASGIIAVSGPMKKKLKKMGAPGEKLIHLPCGPDTERFQPLSAGENPPDFLALGRFARTKSPLNTLRAFELAAKKRPEITLTLAGSGELRQDCIEYANARGLAERVKFPGVWSHEEVAQKMPRFRAFLQHSVTTATGDSEGTPVAIQEAMACGLPIVSTRHAGIPEVVEHEKSGFLVEEGDVQGMAEHILKLAEQPELATQMGRYAAKFIRNGHSQNDHLRKLREILEQVVRENRK